MNDRMRLDLAAHPALTGQLHALRAQFEQALSGIEAMRDYDTAAEVCDSLWYLLKQTELVVREGMLLGDWEPDERKPELADTVRMYLSSASAQVEGVMSTEHEIEVMKGRLQMARSLGLRAVQDAIDATDRLFDRLRGQRGY